jgi:hypothetical protein
VIAFIVEKNDGEMKRQAAYAWAVEQIKKGEEKNAVDAAQEASAKYGLEVITEEAWIIVGPAKKKQPTSLS